MLTYIKFEKILHVLNLLDNPHKKISNFIHIVGTNGKGSTSAILANLLYYAGYKVNVFTSPHLVKENERIKINNKIIEDEHLLYYKNFLKNKIAYDSLNFFEQFLLLYTYIVKDNPSDFNIIEAGIGGLYDITNLIHNKILTILSQVDYDHENILGYTLQDIAYNKIASINNNSYLISSWQPKIVRKIIADITHKKNTKLIIEKQHYHITDCKLVYKKFNYALNNLILLGEHQIKNAALAVVSFSHLTQYQYSQDLVDNALNSVLHLGRLQKINNIGPIVLPHNISCYLDGAHNILGAKAIVQFMQTNKHLYEEYYLVLRMKKNKNYKMFLDIFNKSRLSPIIILLDDTDFFEQQFFEKSVLIENYIKTLGMVYLFFDNLQATMSYLNKKKNKILLIICGSLYFVGDVLRQNSTY